MNQAALYSQYTEADYDKVSQKILLGEKLTASELKLHCDAWEILKNAALWTQKEAPEVARYMKENLRLQEENAEKTKLVVQHQRELDQLHMELYSSLKMFTQSQAELKAELGKLTEKSDMLSTFKCKALAEQLKSRQVTQENITLGAKVSLLQDELRNRESVCAELEAQLKNMKDVKNESQLRALATAKLEKQVAGLRDANKELRSKCDSLMVRLKRTSDLNKRKSSKDGHRLSAMQQEIEALRDQHVHSKADKLSLHHTLAKLKEEHTEKENLKVQVQSMRNQNASLSDRCDRLMSDWNSLKRQLEEFPSPAPLDTQNPLIAVGQLSLLMRTPSLQSLAEMPTNQSFDSAIKNRRKLPRRMVKRINIDLTNNKHGGVQVAMTHADNMETTSNSSYEAGDFVKVIKDNYKFLVDHLEIDEVLDFMFQNNVVRQREKSSILAHLVPHDRNKEFLNMMLRKTDYQFGQFIKALADTGQQHIADILTDSAYHQS